MNKNPVSINGLAVRAIYCTTYKTCFVFIRTIRRFRLSNHLKRRANYISKFEHSNVCPYTCLILLVEYSFHVCSYTKKVCTLDIFYHRSKNILSQDICFIVLSDLFKTAVPWFCSFRFTSFRYVMDNVVSSMGWQGDIKHSIDDFHDRKWKISWYLFWHTSMDVLSVSCSLQNVCRYIPS